jgi:hypothetical protein
MRTDPQVREVPVSELTEGEFISLVSSRIPLLVPDNIGIEAIRDSALAAEDRGDLPRMQYRK